MNIESFREYCLSKNGVREEFPFDNNTLVFKVAGKIFALADVDTFTGINLKVDPEHGVELREKYTSIETAFHMNKKHWITVHMDGLAPDSLVRTLIDDSYDLVVQKLTKSQKLTINS